jgi:sugar transferase (PEP-CTERM system associated)
MAGILLRRLAWRSVTLFACESVLLTLSVAAAAHVLVAPTTGAAALSGGMLSKGLLIALVCQACLYCADLDHHRVLTDHRELIIRSLHALGAASIIFAALYLRFPELMIGPGVFAFGVVPALVLVPTSRVIFAWLTRVGPRERLLLVGASSSAITLARELYERRELGVDIVGFVDPDPASTGTPPPLPGVIGQIGDIPAIVRARSVSRVVVSLNDARGKLPMEQLLHMRLDGVRFDHLSSVYEEYTRKIAIDNLRPSWLIFSTGFHKPRRLRAAKRCLDLAVASAGLIAAAPLMLCIAGAIRATAGAPVLYQQRRVGRDGRIFVIYKFRTMQHDAEAGTGPVWASNGDPRVTGIGHLLRRARLDELPQLWNVIKGQMSLVGPRPERPEFVEQLTRQIPFYGIRHVVTPGLTGWAQVRYTYGASVEDAMEKLQYDLFYIKNMSIALDLIIGFQTIKTVILRRGV